MRMQTNFFITVTTFIIMVFGWLPGHGRHRLSLRFIGLTSNKKSLAPLREQGQKIRSLRYHLACRFRGRSARRQHTGCPLTLALRRKILRLAPVPPALCGPFAASHFRSALSTRNSLWTRMAALLPHRRFEICYAYLTPYVCVCQELFFACGGQARIVTAYDPSVGGDSHIAPLPEDRRYPPWADVGIGPYKKQTAGALLPDGPQRHNIRRDPGPLVEGAVSVS